MVPFFIRRISCEAEIIFFHQNIRKYPDIHIGDPDHSYSTWTGFLYNSTKEWTPKSHPVQNPPELGDLGGQSPIATPFQAR
jgi:hypothetical protein